MVTLPACIFFIETHRTTQSPYTNNSVTWVDINAKQDTATALCFHPHKNIINIASGNEIFGMFAH
jgi:hypothetical protein